MGDGCAFYWVYIEFIFSNLFLLEFGYKEPTQLRSSPPPPNARNDRHPGTSVKPQQTAYAGAIAARDSLKTAELHHRFIQDIRKQVEAEYNATVDAEVAAAGDMPVDRKQRHVEEMEASDKRIRS